MQQQTERKKGAGHTKVTPSWEHFDFAEEAINPVGLLRLHS